MPNDIPRFYPSATRVERYKLLRDGCSVEVIREPPSILHDLDRAGELVHVVVAVQRPGALKFITVLEHEHYDPCDPAREALLETRAVQWMGTGWALLSVPYADWRVFHVVAGKVGMRVADGVPAVVTGQGVHFWPMQSRRVCQLENAGGVPNDPAERAALLEKEEEECEAIRERSRLRFKAMAREN